MFKECKKCHMEKTILQFSKHPGTVDKLDGRCKECVKKLKNHRKTVECIEYPIHDFDYSSKDWQVGKYSGTILTRVSKNNTSFLEARICLNGLKKSKTFPLFSISNKDPKDVAKEWLKKQSTEHNLTRNKIKMIDHETIEVSITQDLTMITDVDFLDLCQKYTIVAVKNGKNYLASLSINNNLYLFHTYITKINNHKKQFKHDNGNTLDNRLCNLKEHIKLVLFNTLPEPSKAVPCTKIVNIFDNELKIQKELNLIQELSIGET
jgi:hypothetical protein